MNNMNFKIPFYGKKGTIKNIKEDDKFYLVYRYGMSENEEMLFYVPKNKNNLARLLDNYYVDLSEYLNANSVKYETYKKSRLKKKINMNSVKLMLVGSGLLLLSSIPLLSTHDSIGFAGIILDTVAIPTAAYAIGEIILDKNDKQRFKFIRHYDQLSHKYQAGSKKFIKKKEETKYNGRPRVYFEV